MGKAVTWADKPDLIESAEMFGLAANEDVEDDLLEMLEVELGGHLLGGPEPDRDLIAALPVELEVECYAVDMGEEGPSLRSLGVVVVNVKEFVASELPEWLED